MKQAHARKAAAESLYKSAADEEARTGIKDPNCKGTVSIPGFGDGADRSALRLPESAKTNTANEDAISLCTVSKPAGTGEGSYITPANGDAKDEAAKSPTAALSKIARQSAALKAAAAAMTPAATQARSAAATAEEIAYANGDKMKAVSFCRSRKTVSRL